MQYHYHYHLQGYIYSLLRGSKYDYVHDKQGYKFFCFSNVFPANPLVKGDLRTLLISSPKSEFIEYLFDIINKPWNRTVRIGAMQFEIDSLEVLLPEVPIGRPFSIITGTPIVMRIPKQKYQMYSEGIEPKKEYEYLYWRSEHPISLFVSQLEDNLLKKYSEYNSLNGVHPVDGIKHDSPFQKFRFKKQISTRLVMKGIEQIVIGTVWEFMFEGWENSQLVQFALDCGLGERNSLGFGFTNLTNK